MIARPGDLQPGVSPQRSKAKRFWTVGDLLAWTEEHFKKLGFATPRLDAELLLAHAMETTRLELYTGFRKVVEAAERARFRSLVARRSRCEPVAYILGTKEFYSLPLEVNPAVLIPRPETELLVDRVLAEAKKWPPAPSGQAPLRILDIGTGSGNIAIALAVQLKEAQITAVDLSPAALEVARRNARRHGVEERIEFVQGDLFPEPAAPELFRAVVSNPPYVAASEFPRLMRDVRDYEPELALVDKKSGSGLGFYHAIASRARQRLASQGFLALEIGDTQAKAVEKLLREAAWLRLQITSDYAGIPRVITAENPPPRS
ncbi:MAG: peptide chain release factor N(5)-glutamine methyltransferase [Planctomycetes bacterium]|nr:peptide chain release factor N(5)-glutamine methyltransferase [Planctomycetota bacterium]